MFGNLTNYLKALDKVKEEMASYGIVNFGSYCKDPCFVRLSQTMVSYTRQLIPHCIAGSFETDPYLGFSHDLEKIPKSIYSDDFS